MSRSPATPGRPGGRGFGATRVTIAERNLDPFRHCGVELCTDCTDGSASCAPSEPGTCAGTSPRDGSRHGDAGGTTHRGTAFAAGRARVSRIDPPSGHVRGICQRPDRLGRPPRSAPIPAGVAAVGKGPVAISRYGMPLLACGAVRLVSWELLRRKLPGMIRSCEPSPTGVVRRRWVRGTSC